MLSFEDFFGSLSEDVNLKGRSFEHAIKWWLKSDPVWASQLKEVWLWEEFPSRSGRDTGIDLVAEANSGEYWAIQCKAYNPDSNLKKADIDSFLSVSNRKMYSHRLLVTTTRSIGANARETLAAQEKPVQVVDWIRLNDSQVDWQFATKKVAKPFLTPRSLRAHQQAALDSVVSGFKHSDRGQLIMACGSGKTLTALRIKESVSKDLTVVLVPSLTLLSQTLNDWLKDQVQSFNWLAVCSDDSVTNDPQDNSRLIDYDFPATTDQKQILKFLEMPNQKVVFSTYHSSPILLEAVKKSKLKVNLLICDEAHRLAGKSGRDFGSFLDESAPVKKRLFMTATPRVYSPQIKKMLEGSDIQVLSMDDEHIFGPTFFNYSFAQAIKDKILTDYRVVIVGVSSQEVSDLVDKRALVKAGAVETDSESLALHVALAKAMKKWNLRRVISFHSRVAKARKFGSDQGLVVQWMPKDEILSGTFTSTTISSAMPTNKRRNILDALKGVGGSESCLVTNARCLTEGIDVPTLDAVVFVDPKSSQVDIIQAVGRAIRLGGANKTHGTIVVPIFIPQGKKELANFDATSYKKIGDVLNALRAHDQEFGEDLDKLRTELGKRGTIEKMPEKLIWDLPIDINKEFQAQIQAESIELATNSWSLMFGVLQRFVQEMGHARPNTKVRYQDYPLGDWVVRQRQQYRSGDLTTERINLLSNLDASWTWDPLADDWDSKISELKEFVNTFGNSRIPSKSGEYQKLGRWVTKIRSAYRLGELSDDKIRLFESIASDWTWDPKEQDWDDMYALLVQFQLREGHTSVPVNHQENGENLGFWVFAQRDYHAGRRARGSMTETRKKKLEAIPGWTWDPISDELNEKFQILEKYIRDFGTSRVPIGYKVDDFSLGKWISHKRDAFRKGKLSVEEIDRFEGIHHDWSWQPFDDSWEEGFNKYLELVKSLGTSRFPDTAEFEGFKVGTWISNQKSKYRAGKLSQEKIERLEKSDPSWTWSKMDTLWFEYLEELRTFVKTHGHADVPYKLDGKKSNLGEWVVGQRKFNAKGKMLPDRKKLLDELGFRWTTLDPWEEGFANLKAFADREGHTSVTSRHIENGKLLSKWMAHQRSKFRSGELSANQVKRLESLPGWDWNPSSRNKG